MYKKIYYSLLLGLVLAAGCKKDPGLVAPTDTYATSNYPASVSDLNSVLAPCYSNLRDPSLFGFNLLPKALANCTHTANSLYGDDPAWNEMTNTNMTITNSYVLGAWTSFFAGVKNCNVLFNGAAVFNQKYARPEDKAAVDLILG